MRENCLEFAIESFKFLVDDFYFKETTKKYLPGNTDNFLILLESEELIIKIILEKMRVFIYICSKADIDCFFKLDSLMEILCDKNEAVCYHSDISQINTCQDEIQRVSGLLKSYFPAILRMFHKDNYPQTRQILENHQKRKNKYKIE